MTLYEAKVVYSVQVYANSKAEAKDQIERKLASDFVDDLFFEIGADIESIEFCGVKNPKIVKEEGK